MAVPSAKAADLGGDCCADLEERVAELEATTARKGNRKMSLTISGQVNKMVMYFKAPSVATTATNQILTTDVNAVAGTTSNTYYGIDNSGSSTRINFAGNAKVTPKVTVGFNIMMDILGVGRSDAVHQANEDTSATDAAGTGDHTLRWRDANWWIEDKTLGRLTVGRMTQAGPVATIDLGGVSVVANSGWGAIGGGMWVGAAGGNAATFAMWTDNVGSYGWRVDGVKYTSPTFAGFIFSANVGETSKQSDPLDSNQQASGRTYGVDLKYAGEFSGFRLAAGIGYEAGNDEYYTPINQDKSQWGGSLAVMHVASGLFLQGDYYRMEVEYSGANPDRDATKWNIQGGISKNWFGLGNTSLYGEAGRMSGFLEAHCGPGLTPTTGAQSANCGGATHIFAGADSKVDMWGLGIVQNLDAAATELYVGYRNYSFKNDDLGGAPAGTKIQDLSILAAGARVKF